MKISICGSLSHHKEMREAQKKLLSFGHEVFVPDSLDLIEQEGFKKPETVEERMAAEAKYNFIGEHFQKIATSDAILVVNVTKNGIEGYIGGNTFLEMGVSFYLKKNIFLLNPIPKVSYELELHAMHPTVLLGDYLHIK
jgi:diphthamide synthase subunit DPH2